LKESERLVLVCYWAPETPRTKSDSTDWNIRESTPTSQSKPYQHNQFHQPSLPTIPSTKPQTTNSILSLNMSATSIRSPTSPLERRDIRSDSLPFKREKEHTQKWSNGHRPLAGAQVPFSSELDGTGQQLPFPKDKVRPMKQWSSM
jgi:hypothetical protein